MLQRLFDWKYVVQASTASRVITGDDILSDNDWGTTSVIVILLKPFVQIQQFMEGATYVTASLAPYIVQELRDLLKVNTVQFGLHYNYDVGMDTREEEIEAAEFEEEINVFHCIHPKRTDEVFVTERSREQI